jgi:hypothetical protein
MYGNVPEYILVEVGYLNVVLYCSVTVIRHGIVKLTCVCVFRYQLLLLGNNWPLSLSTSLISCEIPIHRTADRDKHFPDAS